ncbi:hypothetical protein [Mesoplasma corruscae]|uniref:Uncharacterized protein n=1 Tax=Mesoplasma corruscae TaxID=216874 RepID=A0A2S5RGD0_9MOLU|nr:hypothetical protein [Mesoplasma corruscae]PPE06348.1 hypothetical protein MCORR_v1c06530 [Mesoplasma corruscae]
MAEIIYDLSNEYKRYLSSHIENSKIDIQANSETIKKMNAKQDKVQNLDKKIKS